MTLFKFTPQHLSDHDWATSTYRGVAIIRAPDEGTARAQASVAFVSSAYRETGTDQPTDPWQQPRLTPAEIIDGGPWPAEGPIDVLEPPRVSLEAAASSRGDSG